MHLHPVQIYYEDTDHSGFVYHANYLRYLERAREHMLGVAELVRLQREEGVGFVVYKVELTFREGAVFGDSLEVRSTMTRESDYRLIVRQDVVRAGSDKVMVSGLVQLACINQAKQLVPLPESVLVALPGVRV